MPIDFAMNLKKKKKKNAKMQNSPPMFNQNSFYFCSF